MDIKIDEREFTLTKYHPEIRGQTRTWIMCPEESALFDISIDSVDDIMQKGVSGQMYRVDPNDGRLYYISNGLVLKTGYEFDLVRVIAGSLQPFNLQDIYKSLLDKIEEKNPKLGEIVETIPAFVRVDEPLIRKIFSHAFFSCIDPENQYQGEVKENLLAYFAADAFPEDIHTIDRDVRAIMKAAYQTWLFE